MSENNKQVKSRLITIIISAAITVIVGIIAFMLIRNDYCKSSKEPDNGAEKINYEITDIKSDYADTEFPLIFLKAENNKKNMLYSPLSVKYALQMLCDGASGNTKAQIENVIGNNALIGYDNIDNVLSLANALFIRDDYSQSVKDEYKNSLFERYGAEIKYDSFSNANNINNWICEKTFGQIKDILSDEKVNNSDNRMILINALAVDMEWQEMFDAGGTHAGAFYLDNGSSMSATMMNIKAKSDNISYYKDDRLTAISMDLKQYENVQPEFIAIMPGENLSSYIDGLVTEDLEHITDNMTPSLETENGLVVSIPRFSFDYELSLKNDLERLGITDAFNSKTADFSNMSDTELLFFDDTIHRANIDFKENGVKAAAVTVIFMAGSTNLEENSPVEVKIDKPFMFLIRDKKTDEIWFVGTVYEPNSWENDRAEYAADN